jgi:hypothetical protein
MKTKINWNNLKYNALSAIITAAGILILKQQLGKWATIGILLVALSLYFGIKADGLFRLRSKRTRRANSTLNNKASTQLLL